MRKLRDIIYINADLDESWVLYYGIEFKEFFAALPGSLSNLLLLAHDYYWGSLRSSSSFLDYVIGEQITDLAKQDIYMYGDFCWVDFDHESAIDLLEPQEIAELLYLSHMNKPLGSPFFSKLNNRFAYCAHDDGWRCKLYCRELREFAEVIANIVKSTVSTSKRRKIYPMTDELKTHFIKLSEDGLLIDFHNVSKEDRRISIPIYTIGKLDDMDDMYNNLNRYIGTSKFKGWLVHTNKNWFIES